MKAIEIKVPDKVYNKLKNLASHDHQTVDVYTVRKLEELISAMNDFGELERRAKRGNRNEFRRAMAKAPNIPPLSGDELVN
jgi:predicted DNA-binding protein